LSKHNARIDYWAKAAAPSAELRQWYSHEPDKWQEFKRRYFRQLDNNEAAVAELKKQAAHHTVTFLFSSRETELNNAFALLEYLEKSNAES
jgi:uncharacterized protein YeaO (DUF488 family)